ncbi:nitronate monooxygenase family protein [Flavobacteriales bacterium]|nr:nitronate monooxygenase family protein [Flavobacteriales bacterium]
MKINNSFTELFGIEFPMIMAPMFLVSNLEMVRSGMQSGIAASFPSLNYREKGELEDVLDQLNAEQNVSKGKYGVNLIVQKSNPLYKKHLDICVEKKVPFYITSLGSPAEVIEKAHRYGAKVLCDVTNLEHAQKCYDLGCDGFIAVGQGAGGHAGNNPLMLLVPALKKAFPDKIVIGAGGVATGEALVSILALGGEGVSVGTRFIASPEAGVNKEYKKAIVDSTMEDIVMSTKISGTPCTVINTDYAKKIGYTQNWFERLLSNNKTTKKYFKMLVQVRGMNKLQDSVKPGNYKTLWVAGKSSEMIDDIIPCGEIIDRLVEETERALNRLKSI